MILVDRDLGHFEYEVKQEKRYNANVLAVDLEEIPELFGGDIDEIELSALAWLHSDEMLTFFVVVLAHYLQELEGPAVSRDTQPFVEQLVSGVRLRDILPHRVLQPDVEIIVVVHFVKVELPSFLTSLILLGVCFVDTLPNELTQLEDQRLDVGKNFILLVFVQLLQHILLRNWVSSEQVCNSAQ